MPPAAQKNPRTGKKRRGARLLGCLFFLFCGGGAGLLAVGEKYADAILLYQSVRARLYTWRDLALRDPDRTITIRTPADAASSPYDNLSFGVPGMTATVLDRRGYALGYVESMEQPTWVAYALTAEEVKNKAAKRADDFRVDPYIPTGSARNEDYAGSGYDRGHLAPAADMAWSRRSMSESFYFSNMSPQQPEFNRGIWRLLEAKVRDWAVDYGVVHVVTGPVFHSPAVTVGPNRVVVPAAYYKVLYAPKADPPMMIGFLLPNEKSSRPLHEFAVTVQAVETATRLNFFPTLNPTPLKTRIDPARWTWPPGGKDKTFAECRPQGISAVGLRPLEPQSN